MQNYESNRKKILDLLEFACKNLPANLRARVQSAYGASHIEIGPNDNGTKISSRNVKDGLKFIGWDTAKFKELQARLEYVKVTVNSDKNSKTEPAAIIT